MIDSKVLYAAAAVIGMVAGPVVAAGPYGDVEIEELHGKLYRVDDHWLVDIHYDVEIEDFDYVPQLDLVISMSEHGYALVDERGQPIEFIIPLQHPSELDDDEVEYEAGFREYLPYGSIHNPRRLRLHAAVFKQGYDQALAVEDKSVKYKHEGHSIGSAVINFGFNVTRSYARPRCLPRHRDVRVHIDRRPPRSVVPKYLHKHSNPPLRFHGRAPQWQGRRDFPGFRRHDRQGPRAQDRRNHGPDRRGAPGRRH